MLALVAALVALVAEPALPGRDARGPACTNFISGDASYNATTGTVTADMQLASAGCTGTYLLDIYAFTSDGTGTPLADNVASSGYSVHPETGNTVVSFSYTFSSGTAPSDGVCLVVESYHSGHVADRAPDGGCQPVDATSGGGGQGFS
jgi:hypothetical protein